MPLPTIQPVDWPDWGNAPTFTYASIVELAVPVGGTVVDEFYAGYYNYVLLYFTADGDGNDQEFTLNWMDAASSEGGNVIAQRSVIRPFGYNVMVPMTSFAPVLQVRLSDSTAFPTDVRFTRTLASGFPQNVGYPGGDWVYVFDGSVLATDSLTFVPNGCAPCDHQVTFATDATSWNLLLRHHVGIGASINVKLYDDTADPPYSFRFIPPDSAWDLVFENNDATDCGVQLSLNRLP